MIVALICFIVGALFLPETFRANLETDWAGETDSSAQPTVTN